MFFVEPCARLRWSCGHSLRVGLISCPPNYAHIATDVDELRSRRIWALVGPLPPSILIRICAGAVAAI